MNAHPKVAGTMRIPWRFLRGLGIFALACGAGIAVSGCDRGPSELLVAYSGDAQAYIEPCG